MMAKKTITSCTLILSSLFIWSSSSILNAQEVETFTYTVRPGDSCGRIAHRFYRNWRRYDVILRFNPQLNSDETRRGHCGPYLRPGVVLTLPRSLDGIPAPPSQEGSSADAEVTAVARQVQARDASETQWQRAQRGLELFRGWRVNTLQSAFAELTFRDRSVVHMRENTLVVIYGGQQPRARRQTAQATLERGTLRSRLGELRMQVDTETATTELNQGDALVHVDEEGISRVSNFVGEPARVRGRSGGQVRVRPGFGSKVARNSRPTRPRRLPDPPSWNEDSPTRFIGIVGEGGTLRGVWSPVEGARRYRVEIGSGEVAGAIIAATEVDAEITQFEVHRLPAGSYWARVATIDGDFFESPPSSPKEMNLVLLSLHQPGMDEADNPNELPDPSTPAETQRVLQGTVIEVPEGLLCRAENHRSERILDVPGEQTIRCTGPEEEHFGFVTVDVITPQIRVLSDAENRTASTFHRGVLEELKILIDSEIELPSSLVLQAEDTIFGEPISGEDGSLTIPIEIGANAPTPLTIRVVGEENGNALSTFEINVTDPPSEPSEALIIDDFPYEEPKPVYMQETFSLLPHPSLVGLSNDRREGHRLFLSLAYLGNVSDDVGYWRTVLGSEISFADHARIGALIPIDFKERGIVSARRGNRDVYTFAAYHVLRNEKIGLMLDLGAYLPSGPAEAGSLNEIRIVPSFSLSVRPNDRFILRTRQGAILELATDGPAYWSSAYGVDLQLIGPLAIGFEGDLTLGRTQQPNDTYWGLGLGVGLNLNHPIVGASLAARYALGTDLQKELGDLSIIANLRFRFE